MELQEIVRLAKRVSEDLESLRSQKTLAVMFVDLAGSTEFKTEHPNEEEWLPRLAKFLLGVTRIIESSGRVVKYIGDEVMATFDGNAAVLSAEQAAERVLSFCEEIEEERFRVKIAMDYGAVSLLDFGQAESEGTDASPGLHMQDPHGAVVDRCARLMGQCVAGAVLCSAAFREASRTHTRWQPIGEFRSKGFSEAVAVFQLETGTQPTIVVEDDGLTLRGCRRELARVKAQLAEMKSLRRPI